LVLHDQGLDHSKRIQPQHIGAVQRTSMLQVLVGVLGESHLVGLEQLGGLGLGDVFFLGHGVIWVGSEWYPFVSATACRATPSRCTPPFDHPVSRDMRSRGLAVHIALAVVDLRAPLALSHLFTWHQVKRGFSAPLCYL